jgi:hypothetical protein
MEHFSAPRMLEVLHQIAGKALDVPPGTLDALDLAYDLSLQQEEGRALQVLLAITHERQTLPAEQNLVEPVTDAEGLRRLCLATDPDRSCLHLDLDSTTTELRAVGLAGRPDLRPFADHFVDRIILIEVIGPGQLTMHAGLLEVRCDRNRYFVPDRDEKLLDLLPAAVPTAIAAYSSTPTRLGSALRLGDSCLIYDKDQFERYRDEFEKEIAKLAAQIAVETVGMLVRAVRQQRHGGTLVVSPTSTDDDGHFALPVQAFLAKHELHPADQRPSTTAPWNSGMLNVLGWLVHDRLATRNISVLAKRDPIFTGDAGLRRWRDLVCQARLRAARERWSADVRRCARLAYVDGAVLFDALLEPKIFGAKIPFAQFSSDVETFLRNRGVRHRSAASIARALRGSLVLTISQDGSVTSFAPDSGHDLRIRRFEL